jgi:hypothetical protein
MSDFVFPLAVTTHLAQSGVSPLSGGVEDAMVTALSVGLTVAPIGFMV